MIKTVAIIGYGSFGQLLAQILSEHVHVQVFSRRDITSNLLPDTVERVSIKTAAAADLVILANDLDSLQQSCESIRDYVRADTIVMDVCSVKIKPAEILSNILGGKCRLLLSHPLFGPQSYENNKGSRGLRTVLHDLEGGPFPEVDVLLGNTLGLKILRYTPEQHDKDMAWVHALTFFVGRGLLNLGPPETLLATHYYKELMDLVNQEKQHSYELFMTVQQGNPYADDIRKQFVSSLSMLESEITKEKI